MGAWIQRQILREIKYLSEQYQVITITGARQVGKTTLSHSAFPAHTYVSLEAPYIRAFLDLYRLQPFHENLGEKMGKDSEAIFH